MAVGDVCRCVLRNPADGPDPDCWVHGESRAEMYERARAAGFSEAIEMACSLVAKNVSQYGAALRELRALVPSTSRCAECGFSKECHAENPVTAHRFAPAKTEEPK